MMLRKDNRVDEFARGLQALRGISERHRAITVDDSGPEVVSVEQLRPVGLVEIQSGVSR